MSNTVRTPKGTELPLLNLKGKDYLQVAHRIQWFNEVADRFRVVTQFIKLDDEQTIAQAHVTIFNKEGVEIKAVTATKRETKKDFSDHTEKAETGAIGRALALAGFGTQFAISDLDEGSRLADAPVTNLKKETPKVEVAKPSITAVTPLNTLVGTPATVEQAVAPAKISTFRKNKPAAPEVTKQPSETTERVNGWE